MALTNLQENLLILALIKGQLEAALRTLIPEEHIKDEDLKFTVTNHLHILICSFLDEWKRLEGLGTDATVRTTLRLCSPAISRIRQWTGLHKIRSTFLAHGSRDKTGSLVYAWDVMNEQAVPTRYAETILLGNCALVASNIVFQRHSQEYTDATAQISAQSRDIPERGIRTVGEIKEELAKIGVDIQRIADNLKES